MEPSRHRIARRVALGLFLLPALLAVTTVHAAEPTNFLFVGDLQTGNLLRYVADPGVDFGKPYGLNGNTSNANYITGYGVTEGVHGTGNSIIATTRVGGIWRISRFDRVTGAFIGHLGTKTFGAIGNIEISADASTLYIPDEAGSTLYKMDVATGNIVAQVAMAGVHDVTIGPDGNIYATAYSQTSAQNGGVFRLTSNLTNKTQVIPYGTGGMTRPAGLTFVGNDFYLVNNRPSAALPATSGGVQKYTLANDGSFTYVTRVDNANLKFGIGIDFGPDGNLYVAAIGNFGGTNPTQNDAANQRYNQVTKIDIATNGFSSTSAVSQFLVAGQGNGDELVWPKYIKFTSNFVTPPDPGYVPEPSTWVTLGAFGGGLVCLAVRARRRNNAVR